MKKIFILLALILVFSAVAYAQSVSTWRWIIESKAMVLGPITNSKINKTVALENNSYGYQVIGTLTDNDYKPAYSVYMAGDPVIFNYLKAGDVVDIFLVSTGGRVARLTAPPFIWYGKSGDNNSGGYVEAAYYLYQIHVNGKIISGNLNIVR